MGHRRPLSNTASAGIIDTVDVCTGTDHVVDSTYPGETQRHRGCPVATQTSPGDGVDTTPRCLQQAVQDLGMSVSGSFRNAPDNTSSEFCVAAAGPSSLGHRRPDYGLGRFARIPLPSFRASASCSSKDNTSVRDVPSCSTELAGTALVSDASISSGGPSTAASPVSRPPVPEQGTDFSPRRGDPESSRVASVVQLTLAAGFPVRVAEKIAATVRPSTAQVYESKWSRWLHWCHRQRVDPRNPSEVNLSVFLTELFDQGLSVSAVRGYRSTLNTVFRAAGLNNLVDNSYISSLLRAFSIERPVSRKFFPQWDLPLVLRSLLTHPYEPLEDSDLSFLTKKTAFLVALASGLRRGELCALSYDPSHLQFTQGYSSVRLLPQASFRAKTQPAHIPSAPIVIPALKQVAGQEPERLLCPIRALRHYITRTKPPHLRLGRMQLFIPFMVGSRTNVKPAMMSRWLCSVIFQAYRSEPSCHDTDNVRATAHEIRALATLYATYCNVPIEEVLQAASWRHATTFTSHYLRDLCSQSGDLYSLGPLVAAQHVVVPSTSVCSQKQ